MLTMIMIIFINEVLHNFQKNYNFTFFANIQDDYEYMLDHFTNQVMILIFRNILLYVQFGIENEKHH